ncbi:hypothetical protein B7P43_G01258 [Cryptotermes secundus]|uniref:Uncharacterized protein n=1 Tax=Cryptotermes secundus TaxID=105785 RepID=A0A2J7QNJ5_9NEOP|nr:hypothetical protein B7P43_G01258 [Cryptotermes secundus]
MLLACRVIANIHMRSAASSTTVPMKHVALIASTLLKTTPYYFVITLNHIAKL